MAVVQNLYQIYKLKASEIVKNNCNIESYTITQAIKDKTLVAIGDNLVFQQLRYLHGDYRDHRELFAYITKLRNNSHIYKKQGDYKKASILERHITNVLFVKDIVNIEVDGKKSDFTKFATKGFYVNGIHYLYLCSGSGQIRRNTATFVNEKYHEQLLKALNCGLDEKTSQFSLAKYSAYFALSFSSILWVRTPRVCVIKDFFNTLKNENVDFIVKDENGKASIEKRVMDLELNCADGQGLVDPEFAELWGKDMDLQFTPCSFVARSCFIKGNLVTFNFKEYAHINNITTIRDKWGIEHNIDDIDVLLSESQFKTSKYYDSWEDYMSYATKYNIHWGIARYNKKEDDEYVLSNYQYIQALSLTTEDIKGLIAPTIDWIKKICSGDPLATMIYSFGSKSPQADYQAMLGTAQTNPLKAVVKDVHFLEDSYIQRKIYKNIIETINSAKLGKVWVRGNYQFCIADPIAQAQAALGLPVTGGLQANQVWSKFWVDRNVEKVDLCRSPMIDVHEHNPNNIYHDENTDYWYKYITSGVIYNIYDTSCFRQEDSDYDGDLIMSTDNEYFIKGSHKDHNIITYEKGSYAPSKITIPNITKTVLKGFGTGVGGFSNTATIMYAMSAIFEAPGHEDQHEEIMRRIKLLREIVGQEIDRIKGADKPSIPQEWRKVEKIDPSDDQDTVYAKMRRNAMVISKKPYFFRYLYPELNQRFKQFEASYNQISKDMFGLKFKKLLALPEKTQEQRNLIKRYQKYSPLITAPSVMNKLCREMEGVDFDIRFNKDSNGNKAIPVSKLPTYEADYATHYSEDKMREVKSLYSAYLRKPQITHLNSLLQQDVLTVDTDDYREFRVAVYDAFIENLRATFAASSLVDPSELMFYASRLAAKNPRSFNWGFVWDILGDSILDYIPQGQSYCPVKDPSSSYEYLGVHYSLKDISNVDELKIQDIVYAIFGDPREVPDETLLDEIINSHLYTDTDIVSDAEAAETEETQNNPTKQETITSQEE